jgi:hypothetical protein
MFPYVSRVFCERNFQAERFLPNLAAVERRLRGHLPSVSYRHFFFLSTFFSVAVALWPSASVFAFFGRPCRRVCIRRGADWANYSRWMWFASSKASAPKCEGNSGVLSWTSQRRKTDRGRRRSRDGDVGRQVVGGSFGIVAIVTAGGLEQSGLRKPQAATRVGQSVEKLARKSSYSLSCLCSVPCSVLICFW